MKTASAQRENVRNVFSNAARVVRKVNGTEGSFSLVYEVSGFLMGSFRI